MTDPNFILLYVSSASDSAAFYQRLLGRPPVEASPTFAMFRLESGVMLGLWSRDGVLPAATPSGGSELAFAVPNEAQLLECHRAWTSLGLPTLQEPTQMDFGFTFVSADPDGHRLRVFAPGGQ